MTNQEDISHYMGLAKDTLLATCAKVRKNLQDLFPEIMILLLVLRKKNFTQMAKYGKHNEHTYRSAFRKGIDWCVYNTKLIRELFDTENDLLAVAIDQSYIRKAGKKTYGIGNYWSGCAQAVKHGCEITLLAIVNATQKDAMAFRAIQTPGKADGRKMSLTDFYIKQVKKYSKRMQRITHNMVGDAAFSTKHFTDSMVELGFTFVSRLRKDTAVRYLYAGKKTGKRGRPKTFDGYIDFESPDLDRMQKIDSLSGDDGEYYTIVANVKCLKRNVRLVVWYPEGLAWVKSGGYRLYYSTDKDMSGEDTMAIYHARFQEEYLFRDGKQFTGLQDCQARSKKKLHFAYNAALAAINTAKVAMARDDKYKGMSLASYSMLMHNMFIYRRIIEVSGIKLDKKKNNLILKDLRALSEAAA